MPIKKLDSSWWALRVGLGLAAVLAGLDKFFNLLTNWNMYLSPITAPCQRTHLHADHRSH